jgi:hypothetical protein
MSFRCRISRADGGGAFLCQTYGCRCFWIYTSRYDEINISPYNISFKHIISSRVFLLFPDWANPFGSDDLTFTMEDLDAATAPHDVIGGSQMGGAPPPWTQDAPDYQQTPAATGRPSRAARSPERHTYSVDHVNVQRRKKKRGAQGG